MTFDGTIRNYSHCLHSLNELLLCVVFKGRLIDSIETEKFTRNIHKNNIAKFPLK